MQSYTRNEAVDSINTCRRQANGSWYTWVGLVDGVKVEVKAYKTWVQIIRCPSFKDSSAHGLTVTAFKKYLWDVLGGI